MSVLTTFHGLDKLTSKLGKLREEKRELQIQASSMMRTPKYDTSYSSARLDGWQREIDKLSEREASMLQELDELKHGSAYVKLREDTALKLRAKHDELTKELTDIRHKLATWQVIADDKLIDGADVMKLAGEYQALRERERLLSTALAQLTSAMSAVARSNGA